MTQKAVEIAIGSALHNFSGSSVTPSLSSTLRLSSGDA